MRKFFDTRRASGIAFASALSLLLVVLITYGATTINTNINTGGTLTVTGASTLTGAATLSSTLDVTGATTLSSTLTVTDDVTVATNDFFVDISTNRVGIQTASPNTTLEVIGTASTTNLVVGGGTSVANIVFGFCSLSSGAITASTTVNVSCSGATGVTTSSRVFVSATSSMDNNFVIVTASSTAVDTIGVDILNLGHNGDQATGQISINFFGIR